MGTRDKFREFSEDVGGFRSSINGAKAKNQQKKLKKDEKEAKKLGLSLEEYYSKLCVK